MDFVYSIVAFFATGGAFMYPILLVFVIGTAIAIERFITLLLLDVTCSMDCTPHHASTTRRVGQP